MSLKLLHGVFEALLPITSYPIKDSSHSTYHNLLVVQQQSQSFNQIFIVLRAYLNSIIKLILYFQLRVQSLVYNNVFVLFYGTPAQLNRLKIYLVDHSGFNKNLLTEPQKPQTTRNNYKVDHFLGFQSHVGVEKSSQSCTSIFRPNFSLRVFRHKPVVYLSIQHSPKCNEKVF